LYTQNNYLKNPSTGSTRGSQASYLSLYDLAATEKPTVQFRYSVLPCKLNVIPLKDILNKGTICKYTKKGSQYKSKMIIPIRFHYENNIKEPLNNPQLRRIQKDSKSRTSIERETTLLIFLKVNYNY
jgi:hypothetical protein